MKTLVLLFVLLIGSAVTRNPGISVAVRQATIDDVKTALLPQVLSKLQNLQIPDFTTSGFTISNIVIDNIDVPANEVEVEFQNGYIAASSSGLAVHVKLHIEYTLPFDIKINADTTASASSSDISFQVQLGYSTSSFATVTITNTQVNINNLDIEIDGVLGQIASAIINLVAPLLSSTINDSLAGTLQSSVQQAITQALAGVPGYATIPGTPLGGDYGLSSGPVLTADYMSLSIDGTFYDANQAFAYPPIPQPGTLPAIDTTTNENVQFFIDEYVFNSAAYGCYIADYIKYTITPKMIPSSSPISLNTSSLGDIFPGLLTAYGPNLACQLVCAADDNAPSVGLNTSGLYGSVTGGCILQVDDNGTWDDAFLLNSELSFLVDVSLKNYTLYGNISTLSMATITASNSTIGPVDTTGLNDMIQGLLELGIPIIDQAILSGGFPLPFIPDTNLASAEVTFNQGYMKIGADPIFSESTFSYLSDTEAVFM